MENKPDDIKALEQEIANIKAKSSYSKIRKSSKHTDLSNATVGISLVIELTSSIIVGAAIGYILDEVFDFQDIFLLIFTLIGGIAGLLNSKRYFDKIKNKD